MASLDAEEGVVGVSGSWFYSGMQFTWRQGWWVGCWRVVLYLLSVLFWCCCLVGFGTLTGVSIELGETLMLCELHLLSDFFYPNTNEIMIESCSVRESRSAAYVIVKAMVSCHISCYFLILFFHFILTSVCILHHEICSSPEKDKLLLVMQT